MTIRFFTETIDGPGAATYRYKFAQCDRCMTEFDIGSVEEGQDCPECEADNTPVLNMPSKIDINELVAFYTKEEI